MNTRLPIVLWALFSASSAFSLSLGDANLGSYIGDPLLVTIAVNDDKMLIPGEVRIRLGTSEEYSAHGLDKADQPKGILMVVEQSGKGLQVELKTEDPVSAPFVSFLLVVESPQAKIQRDYSLLLDLPPQ